MNVQIRYWVNGKKIRLYHQKEIVRELYNDLDGKYILLKNIDIHDFYNRFTKYDMKSIITYINKRYENPLEAGFVFILLTLPMNSYGTKELSTRLGTLLSIYFDTNNNMDRMIEGELNKYKLKDLKYLVPKMEIKDSIAMNPNGFMRMSDVEKRSFIKRKILEIYKNKRGVV